MTKRPAPVVQSMLEVFPRHRLSMGYQTRIAALAQEWPVSIDSRPIQVLSDSKGTLPSDERAAKAALWVRASDFQPIPDEDKEWSLEGLLTASFLSFQEAPRQREDLFVGSLSELAGKLPTHSIISAQMGTGKTELILPSMVAQTKRDGIYLFVGPSTTLREDTTARFKAMGSTDGHYIEGVPVVDPGEAEGSWGTKSFPKPVILDTTLYKLASDWQLREALRKAVEEEKTPLYVAIDETPEVIRSFYLNEEASRFNPKTRDAIIHLLSQAKFVSLLSGTHCPVVLDNLDLIWPGVSWQHIQCSKKPMLGRTLHVRGYKYPKWPESKLSAEQSWFLDIQAEYRRTHKNPRPCLFLTLTRKMSQSLYEAAIKAGLRAILVNGETTKTVPNLIGHLKDRLAAGEVDVVIMNSAGGVGLNFVGDFGVVALLVDYIVPGVDVSSIIQMVCRERAGHYYEVWFRALPVNQEDKDRRVTTPSELRPPNYEYDSSRELLELLNGLDCTPDQDKRRHIATYRIKAMTFPCILKSWTSLIAPAFREIIKEGASRLGFHLNTAMETDEVKAPKLAELPEGFRSGPPTAEEVWGVVMAGDFLDEDQARRLLIEGGVSREDMIKVEAAHWKAFAALKTPLAKSRMLKLHKTRGSFLGAESWSSQRRAWLVALLMARLEGFHIRVCKDGQSAIIRVPVLPEDDRYGFGDGFTYFYWATNREAALDLAPIVRKSLDEPPQPFVPRHIHDDAALIDLIYSANWGGYQGDGFYPDDPRFEANQTGRFLEELKTLLMDISIAWANLENPKRALHRVQTFASLMAIQAVFPLLKGSASQLKGPLSLDIGYLGLIDALIALEGREPDFKLALKALDIHLDSGRDSLNLMKLLGLSTVNRQPWIDGERARFTHLDYSPAALDLILPPEGLPAVRQLQGGLRAHLGI